MATIEDFDKLDIRVGRIVKAELLEGGKYSTHLLQIDFGEEIGHKQSCARLPDYELVELQDRLVLGVVNFPPRQIGKKISESLTLGVPNENGECVLITPDKPVEIGARLY